MGRRRAILIGIQSFAEGSGFAPLRGPHNDIDAMARVLTDPARGAFELAGDPLRDAPRAAVVEAIEDTLKEARRDDTVLIHYSGHGERDSKGRLHFATADSRVDRLRTTALRADELQEMARDSACREIILLLDCCFSGAIGRSLEPGLRGPTATAVREQLRATASEASGLFILTSSAGWQTAEEAEEERDGVVLGRFTRAVLERLDSDAPEHRGDVRFSDLATHVEGAFRGQDALRYVWGAQGDPLIARARPRETPEQRREALLAAWVNAGDLPEDVYAPAHEAIHGRGPTALVALVARLLDATGMTPGAFAAAIRAALPGPVLPPVPHHLPPAPSRAAPPPPKRRRTPPWAIPALGAAIVPAVWAMGWLPPPVPAPPWQVEEAAPPNKPRPAVDASGALKDPAPEPTTTAEAVPPSPPATEPVRPPARPATPAVDASGPPPAGRRESAPVPTGTAAAPAASPSMPAPVAVAPAARPAVPPPGTILPKDCAACPELVVIPGGTFTMGSPASDPQSQSDERPTRPVTVAPFAAGRFEVTRREFAAFLRANPGHDAGNACWSFAGTNWGLQQGRNWRDPGFPQTEDDPVVCVSWQDAQAYVAWLNREAPGKGYRLLTEAEWEWAARAQTDSTRPAMRFGFGDDAARICEFGNVADQAAKRVFPGWTVTDCNDGFVHTAPVGRFAANAFKLHDMCGNVWEWVQDAYGPYPDRPTDAGELPRSDSSPRVLRGGSWDSIIPRNCRSARRFRIASDDRYNVLGFRLARTLF